MTGISWGWNFETLRAILELFQFIGTAVLACLGFAVFHQIRLAKESLGTTQRDVLVRVDREAIVLAAQLADRFANVMVPLLSEAMNELEEAGVGMIQWNLQNNDFNEKSLPDMETANEWLRSAREDDRHLKVIDLYNQMESFALYFAWGAANEAVVFRSIAPVFCNTLQLFAPILISLRNKGLETDRTSGPYENIVKLYATWASRLTQEELDLKAADLQRKLAEVHVTDLPVRGLS